MDKISEGLGGLGGLGSILLPLAVGAASAVAPRLGHGLSAGLGVLDWSQRRNKAAEEKKAFAALGPYLSGAAPNKVAPAATDTGGEGTAAPGPRQTAVDPMAALDAAMADPAVQASPTAMSQLTHMKMSLMGREPKSQLIEGEGGFNQVVMPPGGGEPIIRPVPGLKKPQEFGQGLKDTLFSIHGAGPYSPEQVSGAQNALIQKTVDAETRHEAAKIRLSEISNQKYLDRHEKTIIDAEQRALFREGNASFQRLNSSLNTAMSGINKEFSKQAGELSVYGPAVNNPETGPGKKYIQLQQQRKEAEKEARSQYLTQWDDLKTTYPHFQTFKGGTPGYVKSVMDKDQAETDVDASLISGLQRVNPQFAKSFQQVLATNDPEKIKEARRIGMQLIKRK